MNSYYPQSMDWQAVLRFFIYIRHTFSTLIIFTGIKNYRKCAAVQNSISARLPCYFLKGPLKLYFFDIYLTSFSGVRTFKNRSAMRVVFFRNCSKLNLNLENAKKTKTKTKRTKKIIFLSEIIGSENVAINCLS